MKPFFAVIALLLLYSTIVPGPPDHVWIHGVRWKVLYPPEMKIETPFGQEAYAGLTFCEERTILISQDEGSDAWPETLLHEVAHAATCGPDNDVHNDVYNSPPEGDHPGIERIAQEEQRFIRENPRVVWWEVTR